MRMEEKHMERDELSTIFTDVRTNNVCLTLVMFLLLFPYSQWKGANLKPNVHTDHGIHKKIEHK